MLSRESSAWHCEVSTLSGAELPGAVEAACAERESQGENRKQKEESADDVAVNVADCGVDEHWDPAGLVYFSDAPPGTDAWCGGGRLTAWGLGHLL